MQHCTEIQEIKARHIFDSRGNPTVFCKVLLKDGSVGSAAAPSGASTGRFEAVEKRDHEPAYGGMGVFKAIWGINGRIAEALSGKNAANQQEIDKALCALDGSEDKSVLGANALLAVSLACAKAAAQSYRLPLYQYLGGAFASRLPVPFMNVLNGGKHADNGLDIQEFMIVPTGATSFAHAMRMGSEVYHALAHILKEDDHRTSLGDEGGFAPLMESDKQALVYLVRAIEFAGYEPGRDLFIALDAAASGWYAEGEYHLAGQGKSMKREELITYYQTLCREFPILSIEDPLEEEDFEGFALLQKALGNGVQVVGDDLFVTNSRRLEKGIAMQSGSCVLLKPNQVGTLSQTAEAVQLAAEHGFSTMISHRSGETEDTTIADLSVAFRCGQIKAGAPARGERTAKYNRLLEIEDELAEQACYHGTLLHPHGKRHS